MSKSQPNRAEQHAGSVMGLGDIPGPHLPATQLAPEGMLIG